MNTRIAPRLNLLIAAGGQSLLQGGLKGVEKESLRITPQGRIAQTPHPAGLGSALKHPYITTDYSEALIELITPPFSDPEDTLAFLDDLHRFVYRHLGEEMLWSSSMPCEIEGDHSIPIARYGDSNIGRMKHVYRQGLGWRYGRAMQSIAGIHFNYSVNEAFWPVYRDLLKNRKPLGDFVSDQYFGIARNILRHGWLVLYLFGSSPAFCKSFFAGRDQLSANFAELDPATLYRPHATSLRMSDIGYRNDSQSGLNISFDDLESYVASLTRAMNTPYQGYQTIGVKVDGIYRQLNANILQIPNEYYSPIRPKQIAQSCEHPTLALKRRGVRYLELRSLDLGPTHPLGLGPRHLRFLELFVLSCLLRESPPMSEDEFGEASRNALNVACCGRAPGFSLQRQGRPIPLRQWTMELADELKELADILDAGGNERLYRDSLAAMDDALADPERAPSALILNEMRERGESFQDFGMRHSRRHADYFRARPLANEKIDALKREVEESQAAQRLIEANDSLGFDEFLAHYFSQTE